MRIIRTDKKGNEVCFDSLAEASEKNKLNQRLISSATRSGVLFGGYYWKYDKKYKKRNRKKPNNMNFIYGAF